MKIRVVGTYLNPDQRRQFNGQMKNTRRPGRVQERKSFANILMSILSKK